jgi:hypothetical protein
MIVLVSIALATAPSAFDDLGLVLQPGEGSLFAEGVGAPTVEYDGTQLVMYFEAPASSSLVPAGCAGAWHIGRATSADGLTWTEEPVANFSFTGDPGSTRYCAVSQPAVLFDDLQWNLFWSSSREPAEGTTSNQPTGIGWATSEDGLSWNVKAETLIPYTGTPIGLASATAVNGVVYLTWSEYPDIFMIYRTVTGGAWSAPQLVIDHALVGDWASEWVLGPSMLCDEEGDEPLGVLFAGDDESGARSLAWAGSTTGSSWTVDPASPLTGETLDYARINHWEVLRRVEGGMFLWYSRLDETSGLRAIGAATTPEGAGSPRPRTCPDPWKAGDTGDTGDTGNTGGADSGEIEDTATPDDSGGGDGADGDCGCASTSGAPAWVLASAVLLFRRRRGSGGRD